MPKLDPEKIIVICLDIDDTLINFKTRLFNGSDTIWQDFLTRVQNACVDSGFHLIVQIITAKKDADKLVNCVVSYLNSFFKIYHKDGEEDNTSSVIMTPSEVTSYYAMFHLDNHPLVKKVMFTSTKGKSKFIPWDEKLLPAIHFCLNKSKAEVMQYISQHFGELIPARNLFLIDNDKHVEQHISSGAFGRTPKYRFVSAHALEKFQLSSPEIREMLCHMILRAFELRLGKHLCSPVLMTKKEGFGLHDYFSRTENPSSENDINDHINNREELKALINVGYFGSGASKRLAQLEQVLQDMHFYECLEFFKEKALKKHMRALSDSRDRRSDVAAQFLDNLVADLRQAKRDFLCSSGPVKNEKVAFIRNCRNSIIRTDRALFDQNNWGNRSGLVSFFSTKSAYISIRNEFVTRLDACLQAGGVHVAP